MLQIRNSPAGSTAQTDDDGIWHTEQSYIKLMLEKNSYDTICHEHIEYYSLKSLKYLFDKIGFKIIEIYENNINDQ